MSHDEVRNTEAVSGAAVVGCCGGAAVADPATNGLRLSLVSNVAVPQADTSSSATAYFVPFESSAIALYDADSSVWVTRTMTATAQVATMSIPNARYDVYAYWSGTDVLLEMEETPASPTLELKDGVQVKYMAATRRYVGVLATNASGMFEDSQKNRLVWNRNNQVPRAINGADLSDWYLTGSTSVWREVRANPASRVTVASGVLSGGAGFAGAYASVRAVGMCRVSSGATPATATTGIGVDSTTENWAQLFEPGVATTGAYGHAFASYEGYLTPGIHTLHWLESGQSGTTFYCIGHATSPPFGRLGLTGTLVM